MDRQTSVDCQAPLTHSPNVWKNKMAAVAIVMVLALFTIFATSLHMNPQHNDNNAESNNYGLTGTYIYMTEGKYDDIEFGYSGQWMISLENGVLTNNTYSLGTVRLSSVKSDANEDLNSREKHRSRDHVDRLPELNEMLKDMGYVGNMTIPTKDGDRNLAIYEGNVFNLHCRMYADDFTGVIYRIVADSVDFAYRYVKMIFDLEYTYT